MAAPEFAAQNLYAETIAHAELPRFATARTQFDRYMAVAQCALEMLASLTGFLAAYFLYAAFFVPAVVPHPTSRAAAMAACFACVVAFLQVRDQEFYKDSGLLRIRETERTIRVSSQSLFLLWVASLILQLQIASLIFLLSGFIAPALVSLQRHLFSQMVARLRRNGGHEVRVLVYGAGDSGRNIVSALIESQRLGLRPFAVFEDRNAHHASAMPAMGYRGRNSIPVLNGILTPDTLLAYRTDLLLIASANLSPERIAAANDAAKLAGTSVAILCSPSLEEQPFASRFEIDGMQLSVQTNPNKRRFYIFAKRLLDVVLSSLLLVFLSPLLLIIAALIRLDSPGPALFIQERVGLNGSLFRMFKFRTMYASTPKYELSPTSSRDWRITCVGRALRRTGLDELPQLVNVFLGEMSLVGPRPEMPFIVDRYTPTQMQRLNVIPGVTGLWQLSADRAFPIHQNVEYDFYYIRNRTLAMDIAILAHTLVFAMCGGI